MSYISIKSFAMRKTLILFIAFTFLISCKKNNPPEVIILSPSENSTFEQGEVVLITINADDEDGKVEEIRLYLNDVGLAFFENFPYNYSLNTDDLDPGMYTVKVKATDNEGMEATDQITFRITEKEITITENSIKGYVQKGPYLNGTSISIIELDNSLNQTGKNFATKITDNTGRFEISGLVLESVYLELIANGFYFDETKGENSEAQLTLSALVDITDSMSVNVNVMTQLERDRLEFLIQSGNAYQEAKKIAQKEVLSIFHIEKEDISSFEELDITKTDDDHAILLAISSILQSGRSVAEVSELIANISSDIREDGTLDNLLLRAEMFNLAQQIDTISIKDYLTTKYSSLETPIEISNFGKYIAQFLEKENPFDLEFIVEDVKCFGTSTGTIDLAVSGGTLPYTYEWIPSGETTEDLINVSVGTYEVSITDASGYNFSSITEVKEPDSLYVGLIETVDELNGNSGSINIAVTGGVIPYHYNWSNGDTIEDVSNLSYGTYTVQVKDENSCATSLMVSVLGSVIDERDGNEYDIVQIGDQVWMAENLAYLPAVNMPSQKSDVDPRYYVYSYNFSDVDQAKNNLYYAKYGVFYNWPAAQEVCPSGWHLPSDEEWKELEIYLGMKASDLNLEWGRGEDENVGGKLKEVGYDNWRSPNDGATNESRFSARAAGYLSEYEIAGWQQQTYGATFWTFTLPDNLAWARWIDYASNGISRARAGSSTMGGRSVRCLKDN